MKIFSVDFMMCCVCSIIIFSGCSTKQNNAISYPQPLPDSTALSFLPGIVTSDSLDFASAFSPDGKSYYFGRSEKGKWVIYVTQHNGKEWGKPTVAPFVDRNYSEADPAFAPDGSIYYISNRPKDNTDTFPDYDIWRVKPLADGKWGQPENVKEVNSDSTEYYVSFAANGNLYFASSRVGGLGDEDIYISRFNNGKYDTPENLGLTINSTESDHDPCIAKDESFLVFTSSRRDIYGQADLYFSVKRDGKNWWTAYKLSSRFNTPTYEYCSYLTPDDKYFFFSSNFDIKWIDVKWLKKEMGMSL